MTIEHLSVGFSFLKKNMGHSRPLFHYFSSFQANNTIFTNKEMWKMSIQCWNLNPPPLKHESPPMTTRPGSLCRKSRFPKLENRKSLSDACLDLHKNAEEFSTKMFYKSLITFKIVFLVWPVKGGNLVYLQKLLAKLRP